MQTKRTRAFTLVELLVVIAVISILAALLLPAVEGALIEARLTSCASRQRGVGLATMMYIDDFNEHLPSPANGHYARSINQLGAQNGGVLLQSHYLEQAASLFCPAHSETESLYPITQEKVSQDVWGDAMINCTYIWRAPHQASPTVLTLNGIQVISWRNEVLAGPTSAKLCGSASRLSGNITGGKFVNSFSTGNVVGKLSSARALMMCALPTEFWGYDPDVHQRKGFCVLYADMVARTVRCSESSPYMLRSHTLGWPLKFMAADTEHPAYSEPYTNYFSW